MTQPATVPFQVPFTSGFVRGFAHVRLSIAGLDFAGGFKQVDYSRVRDRELPYSNNPDPIGKTLGENKYEAKAVVFYDWWASLLLTVQNNLGSGYGDQMFNMYVSYVGTNLTTYTDTIIGCTFDSTQSQNQQGIGALTREVDFKPIKIYFAGVDDLAVPLVAPPW